MSKHWNPHRTRWLSDSEFRALSPGQRRALYALRGQAKRYERGEHYFVERKPRKSQRETYQEIAVTAALTIIAGLMVTGLELGWIQPPGRTGLASQPSPPVVAQFGYCYSGGGTNCVVDGDTFWINGQDVRIADIDAPETHPSRCDYEARLGEEATERLHAYLNSGAVSLVPIDRDRDVYGRLLRNVSVNGKDVGEALVAAGLAREWTGHREPWC